MPVLLVSLAVFLPLAAFVVSMIFFQRFARGAQALTILCGAVSFAAATILLLQGGEATQSFRAVWLQSGTFQLEFGFLLDPASRMMGVVVALITLCVEVYSLGYMAHDPSKTRYFALLGFFEWSMLSLVYALNLAQLFIFWEMVGLASFFLIGFWFEKPAAAAAAKKAMLMTRVGDIGFFIGMALLLRETATIDIPKILDPTGGLLAAIPTGRMSLIALLLFMGIMGKSAQFPLHTWLPAAMEGPTPVSALLHSATMVAAGVYMMVRLHPVFAASATAMTVILCIATFTMLLASTVAMVETDMKRVLAYSSISQLSFMLMGLAAGSVFAGFFHLVTHAFFKAMLFLCAGLYIHRFGSNQIEAIGRAGGRGMKTTTIGLLVGCCALSGLPPFSGFFSKEAILGALHGDGRTLFLIGGFAGAFLTAYYSFRMFFLVWRPAAIDPPKDSHHQHHSDPASMLGTVVLLAATTVALGFLGPRIAEALGAAEPPAELSGMILAISLALGGVAIAWLDFGRAGAKRVGFIVSVPPLRKLFENAWFVDAFYARVIEGGVGATARACGFVEAAVMNGATDGMAIGVGRTGGGIARLQSGLMQAYLSSTVILVAAFLIYLGAR